MTSDVQTRVTKHEAVRKPLGFVARQLDERGAAPTCVVTGTPSNVNHGY